MRATIKETLSGDLRVIPVPEGAGVWIETEIVDPPSSKGRSVDVFIPRDQVTKLITDLRQSAIAARQRPLSSESVDQ